MSHTHTQKVKGELTGFGRILVTMISQTSMKRNYI